MRAQAGISLELNELFVGKTFRVVIDETDAHVFVARTYMDAPDIASIVVVENSGAKEYEPGDSIDVEITSAEEYQLFGRPVAAGKV